MPDDVLDRRRPRSFAVELCPEHGLRLFPTVVGLSCPVCGAAAVTSRRLAG